MKKYLVPFTALFLSIGLVGCDANSPEQQKAKEEAKHQKEQEKLEKKQQKEEEKERKKQEKEQEKLEKQKQKEEEKERKKQEKEQKNKEKTEDSQLTTNTDVKDYVAKLDGYIKELDAEYTNRKPSNNIDSWGVFGSNFREKMNTFTKEIDNASLSQQQKFFLKTAATELTLLMGAYGNDLNGKNQENDIKLFKSHIQEYTDQLN
ncbi:hypothetical protein LKL98_21325, partial [Bacillus pacificus]|uniref:hypothetical protein n=1 Tax=Bacillus pacificus TaxID=2026187 RepID=UPI0029F0BE11|nr:hypothetical protein [Bacillus pacificus]